MLYKNESDDPAKWLDEPASRAGGAIAVLISVPFLAVGVPVLAVNIYYFNDHRKHARKRDEYQKAYDRYRKRRQDAGLEEVHLMVVPTFDVASAGSGVKLLVEF